MNEHLRLLLAEISKKFGRITRWEVLCQEQHATSDADRIRVAQQVLAEHATDTVAGGYAQWAKLHGAKDRQAPPYKATGF